MSKALSENYKIFDEIHDCGVFMTSSCILGSIRVEKSIKSEVLCIYPICLKFSIGGNFENLITKGKPKLKLENDLSIAVFPFLAKILPNTLQI